MFSWILGTRYYMRIGRAFWLAMNDWRLYFNEEDAKPVTETLAWVMDEVERWKDKTEYTPQRFLTDETYTDLMLLYRGIPEFMSYVRQVVSEEVPEIGFRPKIVSQDLLERTFGNIRQRTGGTQNITVLGLAYNLRSVNMNMLNGHKLMLDVD